MDTAYGGVVFDGDGQILLRKPANEFDGYVWTFAKGRPKPGQGPEETALCEMLEETGLLCEIVARIPGSFEGGTTTNEYFLMKHIHDTRRFDSETEETRWVTPEQAKEMIARTRNAAGRQRDLAVLEAALNTLSRTAGPGGRDTADPFRGL